MVIPNLPDDVALRCLIRLPRSVQLRARSVSKGWNELIRSAEFRAFRAAENVVEDWLLIVARSSLVAYDVRTSSSHRIKVPADVEEHLSTLGFRCLSSGSQLFIIGGSTTSPEGLVSENHSSLSIFDAAKDSWTRGTSMKLGRSYFACGCIGGTLYVAGGEFPGRSVESYDIRTGEWSEFPPMPVGFDRVESYTVFKGKLYIKGVAGGERKVLVLDPSRVESSAWECGGLVGSGIGDGEFVATDEHLYLICRRSGYVGRFDQATEKWSQVGCLMPFLSSAHPQDVFYISDTSADNLLDLKRCRKALLRAVWQCPGAIVRV